MITVNNGVTRNVSRFKKISPEVRKELSKRSVMDEDEIVIPNPPKESIYSGTPDAKPSTLPAPSSPLQIPIPISGGGHRMKKPPGRFRDFVMK